MELDQEERARKEKAERKRIKKEKRTKKLAKEMQAAPERFLGYPVVTLPQMEAVCLRTVEEFGIPLERLFEKAGEEIARQIHESPALLGLQSGPLRITILCGRGNNAADGLYAACSLMELGHTVSVWLISLPRKREYPQPVLQGKEAVRAAGIALNDLDMKSELLDSSLAQADLLVDALCGTGLMHAPKAALKNAIQKMNKSGRPIVALDLPSGHQGDWGQHMGVFIKARMTLAIGLPKKALWGKKAQRNVGELKVVDTGIPKELIEQMFG